MLLPLSFGLPACRISKCPFLIGRAPSCDLVIHELFLSRKHLSITKREMLITSYLLICHSRNCVFINNTRISDSRPRALKNRDYIWLTPLRSIYQGNSLGFIFLSQEENQIEAQLIQKYAYEASSLSKLVK
jgi:pSer/pThr/pTyr-binding forkhead associated (FHA) protein